MDAEGRERGGVQQAPPHQLGDLWEHCKLPQRGSGRNRHRPKGFPLFSALRMASPDTIMLIIVDYHAAIGGSIGGQAPLCTPWRWDTSLAEIIRIWAGAYHGGRSPTACLNSIYD